MEGGYTPWQVILKGLPDKRAEENFSRLLTDRLNVGADEISQIMQSIPVIIFSDLTSHEAEKIKLILNETGVRTAISNDPDELRGLAVVTWPKKITPQDLAHFNAEIPPPPPFAPPSGKPPENPPPPPSPPSPPAAPPPPPPPSPAPPLPSSPSSPSSKEKLVQDLEKMKEELKAQLDRLEKLINSLKS